MSQNRGTHGEPMEHGFADVSLYRSLRLRPMAWGTALLCIRAKVLPALAYGLDLTFKKLEELEKIKARFLKRVLAVAKTIKSRNHLEHANHLCCPCEGVLKQTLHELRSLLLGVSLKQLLNNSLCCKGLLSILKVKLFQLLSWVHVTHTSLFAGCISCFGHIKSFERRTALISCRCTKFYYLVCS